MKEYAIQVHFLYNEIYKRSKKYEVECILKNEYFMFTRTLIINIRKPAQSIIAGLKGCNQSSVTKKTHSLSQSILNKENALWNSIEDELTIIRNNMVDLLGIKFYHLDRVQLPKYSAHSFAVDFMPNKFW